ncbi:MAG: MMPL family transporter [Gammaproteobacteria bacterium]|nr:MMPL family transporter [Gammaproteobacteria bacterium]
MVEQYARWVIRLRWLIVFLTLGVVGLLASGGQYLSFSNDYRVFFSEENPQLTAFENLQDTYTKNDNILFMIMPKGGEVFTPDVLEAVVELTEDSWQIPYSIRVDSISNYQHTYASGDDLIVADLVEEPRTLTTEQLQSIKNIALNEPLLVNRIISQTAHATGVNVVVELPGNDTNEAFEVAAFAREIKANIETEFPQVDVYMTGIVLMNNAFPEASQEDMQTLVPLSYLVVIVGAFLFLRSIAGTIGTVLVIVFSTLMAMGSAGWLGIQLTPPAMSAPTMILTLAVADSIHFLVTMLHEMRKGSSKNDAIVESLRINFQPIFLTSITTAVGFLSMNFSDAPPFRDLGNITAMGVMYAFFLSVLLLPAVMAILPVKVKPSKTLSSRLMEQFAEFVIRRRQKLFWGMAGIILLSIAFIPKNELNDIFVNYFDESIEFRTHTDLVAENLTGLYFIDYSLESGESGGISNPDFLKKVDQFADWYRQQPETKHVNVITDTFKRLNKNMHGDDPAYYKLPEERDLAAQYLLLYEMSLPYGLDLNNQVNVDKSATRISITLGTLSTKNILELELRAEAWLKENAPEMLTTGASPSVMFAHIGERNIRSMLTGTVVALILISMILMVALRSVKMGLISLVPNLIPAAIAFGVWGLFVGEVGLALSVVVTMTLGIVVDDTVHFISKYLRAQRENNLNSQDAVRYAFANVGVALWVTSLLLIAGFLVLTLSAFELNSGMGLLTAITIGVALAVDFLFLPTLLMKLEGKKA